MIGRGGSPASVAGIHPLICSAALVRIHTTGRCLPNHTSRLTGFDPVRLASEAGARRQLLGWSGPDGADAMGSETSMEVKSCRDVRAEALLEEPAVTVRCLVSQLDGVFSFAMQSTRWSLAPRLPLILTTGSIRRSYCLGKWR